MNPVTDFIIAVSSSLTTATLLWMLHQFGKLRRSAERLMKEHRYLMAGMALVLQHLGLESLVKEAESKR